MKKFGLALAAILITTSVEAQEIKELRYSPSEVRVGSEMVFQVVMSYRPNTSLVWCSLEVDFGNGDTKKIRLGEDFSVKNTLTVPYTYTKPGEYVATVDGSFFIEGISKVPAPPCEGRKQQISLKVLKAPTDEQPAAPLESTGTTERPSAVKQTPKQPPKATKGYVAPINKEESSPKPIEPAPAKPAPKPKAESIL